MLARVAKDNTLIAVATAIAELRSSPGIHDKIRQVIKDAEHENAKAGKRKLRKEEKVKVRQMKRGLSDDVEETIG